MMAHMLSQFEQQRKSHLRNGTGSVSRNIRNDNAALSRRCNINDIVTSRRDADVFQLRKLLNMITINDCLIGQDDLGIFRSGDDLIGGSSVVNGTWPKGLELRPAQVTGV